MPSLLYIGHSYHNKTQSTGFLLDLLNLKYKVTLFDLGFDPCTTPDSEATYAEVNGRHFDVVACFQHLPTRKILNKCITFNHGVFFPMYDGAPSRSSSVWQDYSDFQIISFSRTLHNELLQLGLSSHYIQYFPKPVAIGAWGDEKAVFFWNRVSSINLNTVETLLKQFPLDHLHIHRAPDPGHETSRAGDRFASMTTYSDWCPTRADMQRTIMESALYIAPRPYEGIGMSFLEAMAMGRCVIANNQPTMNEYISHGVTGLLYDLHAVTPLEYPNIRQIQQNTFSFIQEGYTRWQKQIPSILDWIEQPVQKKLHLLIDITVLHHGLQAGSGRTGVFCVAYNLLQQLFTHEEFRISLYCHSIETGELSSALNRLFPDNAPFHLFDESSELIDVDAFLSPLFAIPESIQKKAYIKKFTILYDCIILEHPEWFTEAPQYWFTCLANGLNSEDHYFSISNNTARDFTKHFPQIKQNHIHTIPLAASDTFYPCRDTSRQNEVKTKYNIPKNKKYILSLCSLEPRKNLIRAVLAFVELIQKGAAQNLIYVLAGTPWGGFEKSFVREIPQYNQYKDRIIRIGYVDDSDLAPLYSGAEFFVYTSQYEGFGLPPLEAMQCGTPVITSDNSSLPEVVGDAGLMIPCDSIEAHVKAYETLLRDSELRTRLIEVGIQRAKSFSWFTCAETVASTIKKIVPPLEYPKITVVTSVFNLIKNKREEVFRRCVESVHAQNYAGEIEHLISDGASTDGTLELLEEYHKKGWIRYTSQADKGPYDGMNNGLANATGSYVTFLNSDDYYHSDSAISTASRVLERTNADYCYGDARVVNLNTGMEIVWEGSLDNLPFGMHYCHQTMFVKTAVLREMGGFDLQYKVSADSDICLRIFREGKKGVHVDGCHVSYFMGEGLSSVQAEQVRTDHSQSFYTWFGKELGLTLSDCRDLWQLHGLVPLQSQKTCTILSKLKYPEWVYAALKLYIQQPAILMPNEQPATPSGQPLISWGMKVGSKVAQIVDYLLKNKLFYNVVRLLWQLSKRIKRVVHSVTLITHSLRNRYCPWIQMKNIRKIVRPTIQRIFKFFNLISLKTCPNFRFWFIRTINKLPIISNLLRRCSGKPLLPDQERGLDNGSLFRAVLNDGKRAAKKSIHFTGNFVLCHPRLKILCLRVLDQSPPLRLKIKKLIHGNTSSTEPPVFLHSSNELSPRGQTAYNLLSSLEKTHE